MILPIRSGLKPLLLVSIILTLLTLFSSYAIVVMHNSEKVLKAKKYLEESQEFLKDEGKIEGYGYLISHSIDRSEKSSYVSLKVITNTKKIRVRVYFEKTDLSKWEAIKFEY